MKRLKTPLQSLTINSSLVSLLVTLAALIGVRVDPGLITDGITTVLQLVAVPPSRSARRRNAGEAAGGRGVLALAAFLIWLYGGARYEAGKLAGQLAGQPALLAAERRAVEAGNTARDLVIRATAGLDADRAAMKPIVLNSIREVTRYAETPAGRATCAGADRVRGLDQLDAALFPIASSPPSQALRPYQPNPAHRQPDGSATSADMEATVRGGRFDLRDCDAKRRALVEGWPRADDPPKRK